MIAPELDVVFVIEDSTATAPVRAFRCSEFGHLCLINGSLQLPPRGAARNLAGCVSNETPTGKLTHVADEVAFQTPLRADPNAVWVASIAGPATPYSITTEIPAGASESRPVDGSLVRAEPERAGDAGGSAAAVGAGIRRPGLRSDHLRRQPAAGVSPGRGHQDQTARDLTRLLSHRARRGRRRYRDGASIDRWSCPLRGAS
jgi:hypothetical protein